MIEHLLLGLLAGLVAWNVTRETIFLRLRDWVFFSRSRLYSISYRDNKRYEVLHLSSPARWALEFVAGVLECDFCFSHWAAAGVLVLLQPEPLFGSWILSWSTTTVVAVTWTTFFRKWRLGA